MKRLFTLSLTRSLAAVVAAAALAACVQDAPVSPDLPAAMAAAGDAGRAPELGACDSIQVPAGNRVAFRTYARGVQIYRWSGSQWSFVGPEATLYANAGFTGKVGTHYADTRGPAWESVSGSKAIGAVAKRCPSPDGAIQWLLLGAISADGPGIFARTTFIHRVNTAGGTAPAAPGSTVGEEARIPYTTEYYFYRAR